MLHLRLADNIKMDIVNVGCDMGDWIYLDLGGCDICAVVVLQLWQQN